MMSEEISKIAHDLKQKGMRTKDALHIACAVYSKADYFITTDDKLLRQHRTKQRNNNDIIPS
jgi:predicted nucleic acid-binding protein